MQVGQTKQGAVLILTPQGRLDSQTSKSFEEKLLGLVDAGERAVVLDFAQLSYISSAGLRVLLMATKKQKTAGGRLAVCALSDNIREVFEISGFSAILDIHADAAKAVQSLG
ncbi:MAG: STAS domain-containing protein [Thalassobaculales bacterium]